MNERIMHVLVKYGIHYYIYTYNMIIDYEIFAPEEGIRPTTNVKNLNNTK